jgi:hypothetical protein
MQMKERAAVGAHVVSLIVTSTARAEIPARPVVLRCCSNIEKSVCARSAADFRPHDRRSGRDNARA